MQCQRRLVAPSLSHQPRFKLQATLRATRLSVRSHHGTAGVATRPAASTAGTAPRPAAKVDMELIAYDWRARGFTCDLWTDPPSMIWQDVKTKTSGVFMLVSGEVVVEIDNTLLHPVVGQEVLLPADVRHTVHNVGGGVARWLYGFQPRHTIAGDSARQGRMFERR
jgi:mannose-6-phosphate isomerase-like protein (cupin superfamily)